MFITEVGTCVLDHVCYSRTAIILVQSSWHQNYHQFAPDIAVP